MKKILQLLKNPIVIRRLIMIVVSFIAVGGFLFYEKELNRVFIDNSLIDSPISAIVSDNPGKLKEIDVYEGEQIKKGDLIGIVDSQSVRADTDGIIIMANNQIGSVISSQNPLAQTISPANTRVAGTIDENKGLNQVNIGQAVSFTVDALPGKTFWGYVDEVSPSAKQTQISFSISSERPTQQFVVYARFNAQNYPEIKNGMSAKMTVYTKTN